MTSKAKVISTNGNKAEIEVHRVSMCDGCGKKACSGSCSVSGFMEKNGVMRVHAVNKIGAAVGDTVEVESSDSRIIFLAALVFIAPIAVSILFYYSAIRVGFAGRVPIISAVVGLIVSFSVIGIIERRYAKREPDIAIVRIIEHQESDILENN